MDEDNSKVMLDFLGQEIKVGQRAIRCHSYSHHKEYQYCTIVKIEYTDKEYEPSITILSDGNTRNGKVPAYRLITEEAFTKKIRKNFMSK